MLNIVIFGAPGSGKGTQSENLIAHYELFHISTGDVLRAHIKQGTELGKTAKGFIDQGQLIPDELMIDILAKVIDDNKEQAQNGVIFDGFPDDNEETIKKRLDVYHNQTSPLQEFYKEKGLYKAIKGTGTIDGIFEDIKAAIDSINA